MSLIPMLFSNWWEDLDRPHRLWDQHFGIPVNADDLLNDLEPINTEVMVYRPQRHRGRRFHPFALSVGRKGRGASTVEADKDKFQVTLDVSQFGPNDVTVKVTDGNVVVEAKHDEKQDDHGWVSRHFTRKYIVPSQCDIDKVESHLSTDGILSISVPRKEPVGKEKNERLIKIQYTGRPAPNDTNEVANGRADDHQQQNQDNQQIQQQQQQQHHQRVQQSPQQSQRVRKGGRS